MRISIRIICALVLVSNCACDHFYAKKEISDMVSINIGRKIRFPSSLHPLNGSMSKVCTAENTGNMKLVVYTDGDCGACIVELAKWNDFIKINEALFNNVELNFIVYSDNFPFFEYNIEKTDISLPFIYDSTNQFIVENKLYETLLQTLLLDSDNSIVLIGSPIDHQAMQELYRKVLSE
jgi:hypothetical protein